MHAKKHLKAVALFLALTFVLSGCSLLPGGQAPAKPVPPTPEASGDQGRTSPSQAGTIEEKLAAQGKIKKFSNYEELAEFLDQQASTGAYGYYGNSGGVMKKEMAIDSSMPTASIGLGDSMAVRSEEAKAPAGMSGASTDYSKTNVQVAGVDEADIIKTDGKYIYAVARNNLFIIQAFPGELAEILAKIEFKNTPQDIYISGDRLIVYGYDSQIYQTETYRQFRRQNQYTFLKIFDIADRKDPKQVRDFDFEGNYQDSRLIGDYLYLVTNNYNYYYLPTEPVIPRLLENGEAISSKCEAGVKCFAPEVYYFDMPYSSYNFTSVSAVNVKDDSSQVKGEVYLLSAGQNMYVSEKNLYITYTKYISEYDLEMAVMKELVWPKLSEKDRSRVVEIEAAKNYILSESEKMQKISQIVERYVSSLSDDEQQGLEKDLQAALKKKYEDITKELEKTVIHKIAIDKGEIKYQVSGEVTGSVLNQFSMDESNGYFRIATTKNRTWVPYYLEGDLAIQKEQLDSYSNLYVLDGDLKAVGKVENLAPGERIYSARFMQNRAYLVTFRQVDPLFVIDLSSPTSPKVLGKLKIPGFSSYLHPYNDKFLIGLGKDTAETEWGGVRTKGLKLSLFDVSDVADPKEVDTYVMGDAGSDSIALNDHKAFLFSKEKNLLAIPVTIREDLQDRGWGDVTFDGAAVFKVTEKGFELRGKIDHGNGKHVYGSCWTGWDSGWCYQDNNVLRALYISDTLYTFSNQYLKANQLGDLKEIKTLELKKERGGKADDIEIIK